MIHYPTPYRRDKNLGKAYNAEFEKVDLNDWVCLRDLDTLFLTQDAPNIIENYTEQFPQTGIFTCYTNRISPLAKDQLFDKRLFNETNIVRFLKSAENIKQNNTVQEITTPISGMLMVISKRTWLKFPFPEDGKCLGVDNIYSKTILDSGLKIYRMNAILIWHSYRILNGVANRKHLL